MKRALAARTAIAAATGAATTITESPTDSSNEGANERKKSFLLDLRRRIKSKRRMRSLVIWSFFLFVLIRYSFTTIHSFSKIQSRDDDDEIRNSARNERTVRQGNKNSTLKAAELELRKKFQEGENENRNTFGSGGGGGGSSSSSSKNNNNSNSNTVVAVSSSASISVPAATQAKATKISAGFVHMGKSAGSTLSLLLRFGCHSFLRPRRRKPCRIVSNETVISKLVDTYYHIPDFHKLPRSKHQIYIISVRDVLDRTISAFLYDHPQNLPFYNVTLDQLQQEKQKYAYRCFPSLEAFCAGLQRGNSTECDYPYKHWAIVPDNCSELACAAIHGRVRIFNHLFFNYRKIYDMLPKAQPPKRIFVVRKEQLWEDWYKVDAMLQNELSVLQSSATAPAGKAGTAAPPSGAVSIPEATATEAIHVRNTKGMKLPVSRDVSDVRKQQLCKALEPEYKVYFSILDRAENIGKQELKESTRLAQTNCPNLDIPSMVASNET